MKRKWVEISCDYCGYACHYSPRNVDAQARIDGWIITHDGKHFDCKDCLKNYKYKEDHDNTHH